MHWRVQGGRVLGDWGRRHGGVPRQEIKSSLCVAQSSASKRVDIVVKPEEGEDHNLMDALDYAQEQGASNINAQVYLYMAKGTHFVLRKSKYQYQQYKATISSQIYMEPLLCTNTLSSGSDCYLSTEKARVVIAIGSFFNIEVTNKLTIKNVIFDFAESLSIAPYTFPYQEQCSISGEMLDECKNRQQQSIVCPTVHSRSLFQMRKIGTMVPDIAIEGCEFKNILFDMNSVFGLSDKGATLSITGTKFTNFATCGSVISNRQPYMRTQALCESAFTLSSTQRACTSISTPWESSAVCSSCHSLTIDTSTFTALSTSPSTLTGPVPLHSALPRTSLLSLFAFPGPISFTRSTLEHTHASPLSSCPEDTTSYDISLLAMRTPYTQYQLPLIWQHHAVIAITEHKGSIVFRENTVRNNTGTQAVLSITVGDAATSWVEISQNRFEGNAAVIGGGANVIRLSRTGAAFGDTVGCGGYSVADNTFSRNVGCMGSTGAVMVSCNDESYKNQVIQPSLLNTLTGKENYLKNMRGDDFMLSPTALSTLIPTLTSNIVTTPSGLQLNTLAIHFSQNTFDSNQIGPAMIEFQNLHNSLIILDKLTFTSNLDIAPSDFNLLSPLGFQKLGTCSSDSSSLSLISFHDSSPLDLTLTSITIAQTNCFQDPKTDSVQILGLVRTYVTRDITVTDINMEWHGKCSCNTELKLRPVFEINNEVGGMVIMQRVKIIGPQELIHTSENSGSAIISVKAKEVRMLEIEIIGLNYASTSGSNMFWIETPKLIMQHIKMSHVTFGQQSIALTTLAMFAEIQCHLVSCDLSFEDLDFSELTYFPYLIDFKLAGDGLFTQLYSKLTATQIAQLPKAVININVRNLILKEYRM